ncbi:MAG: MFS transporter, partial [Spirochaetota bacterium]
ASDYRHNCWVLTTDGLLFFLGMIFISFESVLPIFLARLGAPRVAIAVVPVAIALGVNLPSLFAAPRIERLDRKLPFVLRTAVWQRIPWAIVALATPLLATSHAGWLVTVVLLATIVATIAGGLVIPAFFDIVAATVPVERRGTLFALRSVLSYLFGIGGGLVVRLILERVAYPANYSLLYGIATGVLMLGLLVMSFVREPRRRDPVPQIATGLWASVERIRRVLGGNRNFRVYIVARGLLVLAFATTSFFPVYLVEEFGLPDSVSGLFAVITAATFVVVNPIFGRLGNRVGYKPVFVVSYVSLGLAAAVGLFAVTAPWAYVLIAFTATSQSVNLLAWNMTVEFAPEGQVPSYIGVSGFFIGLVAPLGILTGVIVDVFGFAGLFVMTAVTAACGLLVMLFGVEEPRVVRRRVNQPDVPI